ncbi:GNAT family N-acetyltransferase [Tateyamaria omphalii]|uniref:GNAT family N-acetyltransferase n=1 Tax=Tateyamaria omphalii TaxID=299262 RepID=UPI001C990E84|nr:GNAT family N-acetyltransferase [Tateyamaria omphalii]MBY5932535.1 GNAT family N-acetyltransferase [Tateyamaria omphalii]
MTDHITTERLTLRRPEMADAAAIASLVGDVDVSRWLTRVPHPYGLSDAYGFISAVQNGNGNTFVICVGTQLVGCVGIERELGYWLGKNHWGRGYASEACRAMVARHFARSAEDLISGHFTDNGASRHVLDKLGFVQTSQEQARCPATGDCHVLQRMVLTQSAWGAGE